MTAFASTRFSERITVTLPQDVADAVRAKVEAGTGLVVPAPVLAQIWRGGPRQALLAWFLDLPVVHAWRTRVVITSDPDDLLHLDPGLVFHIS